MRSYRKAVLSSSYGSLVFSSREIASELEAWLVDVKGWYGGVGVTESGPQRSLGHGAFPQRRRRTARAITLTGIVHVDDHETRDLADRVLSGALWEGEPGTLTVTHGNSVLSAVVELDGEIGHVYNGENAIDLQVPLSAPDPFLYGSRKESQLIIPGVGEGLKWGSGLFEAGHLRWGGGRKSSPRLSNEGNAEAWPTFIVRGNFPEGFSIVTGGRSVEWAGAVTMQAPAVVDFGSGTVTVGDRDVSHMLVRRQWMPIPPGGSITPRFRPRSSFSEGWADVAWTDTYI